MLARKRVMTAARRQETDARCINTKRGMSRRGKRIGAKRVRQMLRKEDEQATADVDNASTRN